MKKPGFILFLAGVFFFSTSENLLSAASSTEDRPTGPDGFTVAQEKSRNAAVAFSEMQPGAPSGNLPAQPEPGVVPLPAKGSFANPGRLFSPSSFWNAALAPGRKLNPNSAALVGELVAKTKLGVPLLQNRKHGTPLFFVNDQTPKAPVSVITPAGVLLKDSKLHAEFRKGVPIPANIAEAAGNDGLPTILNVDTGKLYEFRRLEKKNGQWRTSWGGIIDDVKSSNGVMPIVKNPVGRSEKWGATASGLPAIGGTILLHELKSGKIPHALSLAIPYPKNSFVWPAARADGGIPKASGIPEGLRFRLPKNTAIDPKWSPLIQMMVAAARDYGIVVSDAAASVTFFGEDPTPYGGDPYRPYYGGLQAWDVMEQFPFGKLQALA